MRESTDGSGEASGWRWWRHPRTGRCEPQRAGATQSASACSLGSFSMFPRDGEVEPWRSPHTRPAPIVCAVSALQDGRISVKVRPIGGGLAKVLASAPELVASAVVASSNHSHVREKRAESAGSPSLRASRQKIRAAILLSMKSAERLVLLTTVFGVLTSSQQSLGRSVSIMLHPPSTGTTQRMRAHSRFAHVHGCSVRRGTFCVLQAVHPPAAQSGGGGSIARLIAAQTFSNDNGSQNVSITHV